MINFYTYSFIKSYLNTSNVPAKKKKKVGLPNIGEEEIFFVF